MQEPNRCRKIFLVTFFCLLVGSVAAAQGPQAATLRILTYNIYEGTDFAPLRALLLEPPEQQLAGFPVAVGASLQQVIESDPVAQGHDAWVVGNEPVVVIDVTGMADYAKQS